MKVINGIENATGEELIERILDFSSAKDVKETSTEEGALLGWLLHMVQSGAFEDAKGKFVETNNIIERLISAFANKELVLHVVRFNFKT